MSWWTINWVSCIKIKFFLYFSITIFLLHLCVGFLLWKSTFHYFFFVPLKLTKIEQIYSFLIFTFIHLIQIYNSQLSCLIAVSLPFWVHWNAKKKVSLLTFYQLKNKVHFCCIINQLFKFLLFIDMHLNVLNILM